MAAQGTALRSMGKYQEAADLLEKSVFAAEAGGYDELVARSAAELVYLYGTKIMDEEETARGRPRASAAVERANEALITGKWERIQGSVAVAAGALDDAKQHFRRSLELLQAELGQYHPQIAASLGGLAMAQSLAGELEASEATRRRALELWRSTVGAAHPYTANAERLLAAVLMDQGKIAEARELVQHALASLEAALGPEHPDVAMVLNDAAEYAVAAGDLPKAAETLQRSLAIKRQSQGPDHPRLVSGLMNLAEVERRQGHAEEALASAREAMRILELRRLSARWVRAGIAVAEAELASDPAAARAQCERVDERARKEGIELGSMERARLASCVGRGALASGAEAVGVRWLDRAIDEFGNADSAERAVALFAWATRPGAATAQAIERARTAYELFVAAGPAWSREVSEVRGFLRGRGVEPPVVEHE
jgi:tetratricopeptide (TPR) repeat protein